MRILTGFRRLKRDEGGAAAVEFGLIATMLLGLFASIIDYSWYLYAGIQVESAAQSAARSAWVTCDPVRELPASLSCSNFTPAVTGALHSTSLRNGVVWSNPPNVATPPGELPLEAYYCLDGSGNLTFSADKAVSTVPTCPGGAKAGLYVRIIATYTYSPLIGGLSMAHLLGTNITRRALMRLR